jgi:uncharacterized membrane protein YgcG
MKSIILRVLFIIAIIVIIIILAFAVIRFVPAMFSSFASVGKSVTSPFKSNEVLVEANETNLQDGDAFSVSWNYDTDTAGAFNLSYPCIADLKLNVINNDGVSRLLCNTQYPVNPNNNVVQLETQLEEEGVFADLPIKISFVDASNRNVEATGEVVVTVSNSDTPVGTNSGTATIVGEPINDDDSNDDSDSDSGSNNNTSSGSGSGSSGSSSGPFYSPTTPVVVAPADLAITRISALGDLSVSFDVYNIGGQSTGNWYFSYVTPGEDEERSNLQPNLTPGSGIRYTLTLDESEDGDVLILVDSTDSVNELSEINNAATIEIDGGNGSNYSYNDNDDADLEIDEFEVGRMSGSRFIEDDEIDEDDDAAIRFVVVNRGGESTGSWRFEINDLPYDNDDDYRSKRQDSLRPGESVEIIVEFENPDEGRYDIEVEVDSDDDVDEEDERNNDESERLDVEN